jgi:hypothetical protein
MTPTTPHAYGRRPPNRNMINKTESEARSSTPAPPSPGTNASRGPRQKNTLWPLPRGTSHPQDVLVPVAVADEEVLRSNPL